jgi:uncharacterized protein YgiB involved in biofilm formation
MKKSANLKPMTIGAIATSAFVLVGCVDEKAETVSFASVGECSAVYSQTECAKSYDSAIRENAVSAPRYDAKEVCESEHGVGACVVSQSADGSSVFLPLMAGFMIGKMLSDNKDKERSQSSAFVTPVYARAGGGYATTTGYSTQGFGIKANTSSSVVKAKPAPTLNAPPMTKVTVSSRGGFGASGGARGVSAGS